MPGHSGKSVASDRRESSQLNRRCSRPQLTLILFWPNGEKQCLDQHKGFEHMSIEELKAELKRLKDSLCDLEDMHSFVLGKTSVHIGAEKAQNMQAEFEEECRRYEERIAEIEKELKTKGAG
jgi:oligoendopeptidase F